MTKKTETKSKVKGADAEQRVLKKIQDGNKAAAEGKKEHKKPKFSSKKDQGKPDKKGDLGKRTFGNKDENRKPKSGSSG